MNKNMKYWATGIIAAIVILAIAAFAAAGSRKKSADSTRTDGDGKQQPDRGTVVRFGGK